MRTLTALTYVRTVHRRVWNVRAGPAGRARKRTADTRVKHPHGEVARRQWSIRLYDDERVIYHPFRLQRGYRTTEVTMVALETEIDMSERVSEAGDQPECTDPSLTDPVCAYQLALAAMRMGTFRRFDPNLLHTAMRDILASNDPAAPDAFDYLCSAGVPSLLSRTGEEPYAVLAARRSDHPKYRSLLVTLQ